MDQAITSFQNIKINNTLVDEIWNFNPRSLNNLDGVTISMYSIALAQFLIYFKSEQNQTKAEIAKKNKLFESSIAIVLDKEVLKQYKTKSAATDYLISTNVDLSRLNDQIDELKLELIKLDGIDKTISEYIATFKRELTRRENELYAIRAERK